MKHMHVTARQKGDWDWEHGIGSWGRCQMLPFFDACSPSLGKLILGSEGR